MTSQTAEKTPTERATGGDRKRLSLNERLGLISLIDQGMREGSSKTPIMADLFNDLWTLVNATVSGSKINRLKPKEAQNGFRVFEINSDTGENLGRLNMLYLNKPIPCYYLVYVEVAPPFRRKGLGNRVLQYFGDFLRKKSALGILDNIIPEKDPTYRIYYKHAWEAIEVIVGDVVPEGCENYMAYIPTGFQGRDLREPVLKLLYHLKRKRATIDMRENEHMVQRTIAEFKDLYEALLKYFEDNIQRDAPSPLMRFMFTRYVTKLISFRRRIGELIGYTGGDSLEQITLPPEIASLPVQSYAPADLPNKPTSVNGDMALLLKLPDALKKNPAGFIEALPHYQRPSLMSWLRTRGKTTTNILAIGDLMDLGFDPTRLKEMVIDGEEFIFERVQARLYPELEMKKDFLEQLGSKMKGARARNALVRANPPLLAILDRGNAYVLRRKVQGIHWEEAVEQIQCAPVLKNWTASLNLDRVIKDTVRSVHKSVAEKIDSDKMPILDGLACFVSWELEANQPKLMVDFDGTFLESVWLA